MWVKADLPDPATATAVLLLIQAGTLLLTSLYKSPSDPGVGGSGHCEHIHIG